MELTQILAFNLVLLAALISPGPAMLCAMQTSLSSSRRAGVHMGLGLALMAGGWTFLALWGLESVFVVFPYAYGVLKVLGGVYLCYIAIQMWRHADRPLRAGIADNGGFLRGIMVNLLNPKSVLFAGSVLIVVFPPDLSISQMILIMFNQVVIEGVFYACLAYLAGTSYMRQGYQYAKSILDRVAGGVLAVFGLHLLIQR